MELGDFGIAISKFPNSKISKFQNDCMFSPYLKQTFRSLTKHKTYSILNIIGLSAGLTCFAFIALWVSDELSFDKFNTNYDRIVRLVSTTKTETGVVESAVSSAPMAKALKDDYPEVENTVRVDMHEEIVEHQNQQVLQPGILLTDPSFFDVFSYTLSRGNAATAVLPSAAQRTRVSRTNQWTHFLTSL